MTSASFAVRTEGLGRAYDEHYALIGLDATFPAGSITALLGPNGAGKSTLIGILSTLVRPTEGALYFGDLRLHGAKARMARQHVGYVGHRTMLYKPLSAKENLRFFGKLYRLDDLDARVDTALAQVGLDGDDLERPVMGFSRGMMQRLTLARALLPRPQILLLDEPLTGLDQAGVALALDLFAQAKARGAVIIVASHDLEAIGRVADRALILRRGRKRHLGPIAPDLATLYRESIAA